MKWQCVKLNVDWYSYRGENNFVLYLKHIAFSFSHTARVQTPRSCASHVIGRMRKALRRSEELYFRNQHNNFNSLPACLWHYLCYVFVNYSYSASSFSEQILLP